MMLDWIVEQLEGFVKKHKKRRRKKPKKRTPKKRRKTQKSARRKKTLVKRKTKRPSSPKPAAKKRQVKITRPTLRPSSKTQSKVAVKRRALRVKPIGRPAPPRTLVKKTASASKQVHYERIGTITHYFTKIQVGVIHCEKPLRVGDRIEIHRSGQVLGKEKINSMQINHIPVDEARKNEEIGIKIKTDVKPGDIVVKK